MLQLMPSPAVIQKCLGVISTCAPSWQDNLATGYLDNDQDKKLLTALSIPRAHPVGFSLVDGLIQFHNRIQVGHNKLAQQHVLQALHSSGIGGHSGIQGTYQQVKCLFAWPKMKQLVTLMFSLARCASKRNHSMLNCQDCCKPCWCPTRPGQW
jgi:hypothetical protein